MNKNIKWFIGCSGFYYKEWKTAFYPEKLPQKNWFEYYAQHFNTLELNVTFYRFPELIFLQNWYNKSPDGFLFSVKAPRLITHYKKFTDTEKLAEDFYNTVGEGLQNKLGCILFQLPPGIAYTPELLERIINAVDPSFRNVIEFRNQSWWNDDVREALATNNITFCSISIAKLPDEAMTDTNIAYYRFHGVPLLYKSEYSHQSLKKIADSIIADKKIEQACIYFNNTWGLAAVNNAEWLRKYCAEHSHHE